MSAEIQMGQHLMLAFPGKDTIPPEYESTMRSIKPAGYTLFRHLNIDSPEQVFALTSHLQKLAKDAGMPPLFIATDQEGGQLMSIGDGVTQLPGNMAIGATGSSELARQAGEILGREMAALGINTIYAPVCDVNINPQNPVIGVRSFSEDPDLVSILAAAMIEGIQSTGVIASAKHFPGHGDTSGDSHHGITSVPHDLERLEQVEFKPFRASIQANVKMMMTAHLALPKIEGRNGVPATLSQKIIHEILRKQMGYEGVVITDAMDMKAIAQGKALGDEAIRAIAAGVDLLLLTSDLADQNYIFDKLSKNWKEGSKNLDDLHISSARISRLKAGLNTEANNDLSVLDCRSHRAVAETIARKSVTLVRDELRQLPLKLQTEARVLVIMPETEDLTPADTSSYLNPSLANAIRNHHSNVEEIIVPHNPDENDIAGISTAIQNSDYIIIGTINAFSNPAQAALVNRVIYTGKPVIVLALRLPYDLVVYPQVPCYLCTYGILKPSLQAVADAIFGRSPITGKLPVTIPSIAQMGFGMTLS